MKCECHLPERPGFRIISFLLTFDPRQIHLPASDIRKRYGRHKQTGPKHVLLRREIPTCAFIVNANPFRDVGIGVSEIGK